MAPAVTRPPATRVARATADTPSETVPAASSRGDGEIGVYPGHSGSRVVDLAHAGIGRTIELEPHLAI